MKKLKSLHATELLQAEEHAAQRYSRQAEELREHLEREKEALGRQEWERAQQRWGSQPWWASPVRGGGGEARGVPRPQGEQHPPSAASRAGGHRGPGGTTPRWLGWTGRGLLVAVLPAPAPRPCGGHDVLSTRAAPERVSVRSFEQHLEQEQRALQQQRRRLYNEVAEEKERLGQQAARCRGEGPGPPPCPPPCPAQPCRTDPCLPAGSGRSWRS